MLLALAAVASVSGAALALPGPSFEADVMARLARLETDNAALTAEVTALRGEVAHLSASDAARRRTQPARRP